MTTENTCGCRYREDAPRAHDAWIEVLEHPTPRTLRDFLEDLVLAVDFETDKRNVPIEWDQLIKFVACHNWVDPVAVCGVAEWVQLAMKRYVDAGRVTVKESVPT